MNKPRVFDHLDGSPADEDRHFSRVARIMRSAAHWVTPTPGPDDLRGHIRIFGKPSAYVPTGEVFGGLIPARRP